MKASVAAGLASVLWAGCGGMGGGASTSAMCMPDTSAGVAIAAGGFAPKAVCVISGGTVVFSNTDAVAHDVEAGAGCPQLSVGAIDPGQSKSATLPMAGTCPFVDAAHAADRAFQGTVTVSTQMEPGYPPTMGY